jgi:6-phosphogluconolactonase (cycloisomerase 2 family)
MERSRARSKRCRQKIAAYFVRGSSIHHSILRRCSLCWVLFLWATPLFAQPSTTLTLKPGVIDRLVPVMAHQARCVALSDRLGLLAFGHDKTVGDDDVSLFKLDDKGIPSAKAITWKLPSHLVLAKDGNYPLSMTFHPKLPLLYIWQEANLNYTAATIKAPPAAFWEFDHLIIYDVSKSPPELVIGLCRGEDYLFGQQGGAVAIDPEGAFLYIPNVREKPNRALWKFGRFPLDSEGLPKVLEKEFPREEKLKELIKWNAKKTPTPEERTPPDHVNTFAPNPFGSVMSMVPLNREVILAGGTKGVMTWRPEDKIVALNALPLKFHNPSYLAVHPKLPAVFVCRPPSDSLFRVEQVDGYWTLLPRQYVFPETKLTSMPAVLTKSNQVAVGGHHFVYLLSLDSEGHPQPEVVQMQVFNPGVRALVYSEKFDRLYVSMDLSK